MAPVGALALAMRHKKKIVVLILTIFVIASLRADSITAPFFAGTGPTNSVSGLQRETGAYAITTDVQSTLSTSTAPLPVADTDSSLPTISLSLDKKNYVTNEDIVVSGKVLSSGKPAHANVELSAIYVEGSLSSSKVVYRSSIFSPNGNYTFDAFRLENPGEYNITIAAETVRTMPTSNDTSAPAMTATAHSAKATTFTIISVRNPLLTWTSLFLIVAAGSFGVWMYVIASGKVVRGIHNEVVKFLLLSTIFYCAIGAIVATDLEIGASSPMGLVIKRVTDQNGQPVMDPISGKPKTDWMINIGGEQSSNYTGGLQIPVNVFIFGIIGGYLRFLFNLRKEMKKNFDAVQAWDKKIMKETEDKSLEEIQQEYSGIDKVKTKKDAVAELVNKKRRTLFLFASMEDLAYLLLSPIVAIAAWFMLYQGGTTGIYAIALVSITVGLITEEVVKGLIETAKKILKGLSDADQKDENDRPEGQNESDAKGTHPSKKHKHEAPAVAGAPFK